MFINHNKINIPLITCEIRLRNGNIQNNTVSYD